jgi:hypothetical protein
MTTFISRAMGNRSSTASHADIGGKTSGDSYANSARPRASDLAKSGD